MSPLSRRELLRLATGAAASAGIAALGASCGSPPPPRRAEPSGPKAGLRPRLRELVDQLEEVYPIATALAITGTTGAAGVDPFERGARLDPVERVRFDVFDGTSWFSQTIESVELDALASAASRLRSRAPSGRGGQRPTREARARDFFRRGKLDVRAGGTAAWIEAAAELHQLGQSAAASRIIYRGGFVAVSDLERLFVGGGYDLRQTISRVRAGVVMLSWNGVEMIAEEAGRSGTGGLEIAELGRDSIAGAVRRALSLSAGPPPQTPDIEVVLAPSVVAPLIARGIADLLDGRTWQSGESRLSDFSGDQIGDHLFSLVDDPTADGGYASYDFDDEGWLSAARPLVHRGAVHGPYTDRRSAAATGRPRTGHARLTERGMAPRPSNLAVLPGGESVEALVGAVKRGYLIDGGLFARCDPLRWRVLVRARNAREIEDGALSGRVMGPVTVTSGVKPLLLGIRAVGSDLETAAFDDGVAVTAPHLLTRAEVG